MAECKERNCKSECYKTEEKCILHCTKSNYTDDFRRDDFLAQFYMELIKYIIKNISIKKFLLIWNKENTEKISIENYDKIIERVIEYLNNDDNIFDKLFEKRIVFNNIFFPEYDVRDHYDYSIVFRKLKKIHFNFCKFSTSYLDLKKVEVFFQDCEFMYDYSISNSEILYNQSNVIYEMCLFHDDVSIRKMDDDTNLISHTLFRDCDFKKDIQMYGMEFKKGIFNNTQFNKYISIDSLIIKNCIVNGDFILLKYNIGFLSLEESEFKNKVKIQYSNKIHKAVFYNTSFNDLADFYESKFIKSDFERTKFDKIVVFARAEFDEEINFQYTTFGGNAIFKMAIFKNGIDLEDSIIHGDMNFLKAQISSVGNRETARIIKHSFDDINNIIEANKYYKIEMKEREIELKNDNKRNWIEWIVFKIHGISSNHSQNWLLALFWICIVGVFASYFSFYTIQDKMGNYVHFNLLPFLATMALSFSIIGCKYIFKRLEKMYYYFVFVFFPLLYYYTTNDSWFTLFANTINPFSIMIKGDTLNLGMLIFKVIIAYLMYQFVVSIRQNTRRK